MSYYDDFHDHEPFDDTLRGRRVHPNLRETDHSTDFSTRRSWQRDNELFGTREAAIERQNRRRREYLGEREGADERPPRRRRSNNEPYNFYSLPQYNHPNLLDRRQIVQDFTLLSEQPRRSREEDLGNMGGGLRDGPFHHSESLFPDSVMDSTNVRGLEDPFNTRPSVDPPQRLSQAITSGIRLPPNPNAPGDVPRPIRMPGHPMGDPRAHMLLGARAHLPMEGRGTPMPERELAPAPRRYRSILPRPS